jgi:predicted GNAT family acetyltransferase
MNWSIFRHSSVSIVNVAKSSKQVASRQQIIRTSTGKYRTVNMSGACDNSGTEKKAEIVWDGKEKLFKTPDGKAYLSYSVIQSKTSGEKKPEVLDLQHTFVPGSFRGQGMAGKLCVAAFEHAKEKGYLVQPTCSYISDTFLPRNPQWNDLVVKDGATSAL